MFFTKCVALTMMVFAFERNFLVPTAADSFANIHLLKDEVAMAMKDCGGSSEMVQEDQDQVGHRFVANAGKLKRSTVEESKVISNSDVKEDQANRKKRSIYQAANGFLRHLIKRSYDGNDDDGEWNSDEEDRDNSEGHYWNDPKDDRTITDNVYTHQKRNNNNTSQYGGSRSSSQDRNNSRSNNRDGDGYNESRWVSNGPGYGRRQGEGPYRSVKDLNYTTDYYDQFMTRGIRSVKQDLKERNKRYDKLVKIVDKNECLSQCVFTNLQIVDDRGIPKESLFAKLIQDTMTSQQSKNLIETQLKKCFHELSTEDEDNGCSYSNLLDRCMGMQLIKRKSLENEKH